MSKSMKKPSNKQDEYSIADEFAAKKQPEQKKKPKGKPKIKAESGKSNPPPQGQTRIIANVTLEQRRKIRMKAAMEDKSITQLIGEWIDENC